jgi:hypothetical protein
LTNRPSTNNGKAILRACPFTASVSSYRMAEEEIKGITKPGESLTNGWYCFNLLLKPYLIKIETV